MTRPQLNHTGTPPTIRFIVKTGKGQPQTGTVNRQGAICIACKTPVPFEYLRSEGKAGRMDAELIAIVADGLHGRVYLSPNEEHSEIARKANPMNVPETNLPKQALSFRVQLYGMLKHRDLFTHRQLVALTTFSDLVNEARERVVRGLTPLAPLSIVDGEGGREATHEEGGRQVTHEEGGREATYGQGDGLIFFNAHGGGTNRAATPLHSSEQRDSASAFSPSPSLMERGPGGEARRALCRELRQRQTPAEEFFWELVRNRRFEGYKFRRQHPLSRFIADFYCPELCLAVELDGGVHATQAERDRARDEILEEHGIRVARIRNESFLADPEATMAQLSDLIAQWKIRDQAASTTTLNHSDAQAYADAVATYLALAVDRLADRSSTICSWDTGYTKVRNTFARQAIPMVWDFAEANPFSESTGNFQGAVDWVAEVIQESSCNASGEAKQRDATSTVDYVIKPLISTDPPYYDNIGYADLSDFFYVWLRRSLQNIYPDLFATMLVPKTQELVATPYRFDGSKMKAQEFFEQGLAKVFEHMRSVQNSQFPLTVYYAFKQSEAEVIGNDDSKTLFATASTGWETMLEGLIKAGFTITGTWPTRTEMMNRSVGLGTNALASSIVLVCRPRPVDAPIASRREFLNALRSKLPNALKNLQHGSIAPVDLAQASIGQGMAIYSRYSKVIESDGTSLSVRTALQLINRTLDEVLAEQEGEYDAETRWAIAWFEEYAMNEGPYGRAETLSKAKNVAIESLVNAGFLEAKAGKVRLLKREDLSKVWDPKHRARLTVWEVMQRMIQALLDGKGESEVGDISRQVGENAEIARDLAYRLYTVCERKGWAQEALAYNSLVTSWSEVSRLAQREASDVGLWAGAYLG